MSSRNPACIENANGLTAAGLHDEFYMTVYWTAYRVLSSVEEAQDVVQDVFLRLPDIVSTYGGRGSLEGWFKRVALRTALMQLRKRRQRQEVSLRCARGMTCTSFASRIFDRLTLEQALARLPRCLLVVFVLKEVEGYTHEEIGRRLGIRPGTSKARLHHARRALQVTLGDRSLHSGN